MKHNVRINGQVKTMNFELGSGIYDKNGNEIFEGDTVLFRKDFIDVVDFRKGACCLEGSALYFYDETKIAVINKD